MGGGFVPGNQQRYQLIVEFFITEGIALVIAGGHHQGEHVVA